jgi:hypothetical protein
MVTISTTSLTSLRLIILMRLGKMETIFMKVCMELIIQTFNLIYDIFIGLGFFPQHIKLTNMFEAAMQAVDPR